MLKNVLRHNAKRLAMLISPIRKLYYEREGLVACNNEVQQSFIKLASKFTPLSATNSPKLRVGRQGDGGYIMLNDFEQVTTALSFGISTECSWDTEIAARGIEIYQFDHTVSEPPVDNIRFHFFKIMISGQGANNSKDIQGVLNMLPLNQGRIILKCDIEGYEWEVFDSAAVTDLEKFSQIVCEFHHFSKALDEDWFQRADRVMIKLKSIFEVVHVHANNWDPILPIANVPFPEVLEVTFANRKYYSFVNNSELFPTSIDFPNRADQVDIFLGNFKFR